MMKKRKINQLISCILFISIIGTSCYDRDKKVDKNQILGMDYRLFQETPVWELAKAVEDQDTAKIRHLALNGKLPIDYQEERLGQTLLQIAVMRNHYKSVKTLLEMGADPNKKDSYDGRSAMIQSADRNSHSDDPTMLKLMLKYGGDPNDEEVGPRREGSMSRRTPLINASCYSLEKVKILVEAGADINHTNDCSTGGAISTALNLENMDIVLYLLEHGARIDRPFSYVKGEPFYICNELQFCLFPLDSKEYQDKLKIYSFLRSKGIDCKKLPLPEHLRERIMKEHPNDWKEYIEKY